MMFFNCSRDSVIILIKSVVSVCRSLSYFVFCFSKLSFLFCRISVATLFSSTIGVKSSIFFWSSVCLSTLYSISAFCSSFSKASNSLYFTLKATISSGISLILPSTSLTSASTCCFSLSICSCLSFRSLNIFF